MTPLDVLWFATRSKRGEWLEGRRRIDSARRAVLFWGGIGLVLAWGLYRILTGGGSLG